MNGDLRRLLRQVADLGFEVEQGNRSPHWKVRDNDGKLLVVLSSTASDHRSIKNARAQLRRAGVAV